MRISRSFVLGLILIAFAIFPISTVLTGGVINLPQAEQTKCYDTAGTEINCVGTGQDGEIPAGAGGITGNSYVVSSFAALLPVISNAREEYPFATEQG